MVAAGAAHRPHPFLPVDASQDNPICDVCGLLEAAPRHSVQDQLPDGEGEEHDPDGEEHEDDLEGDEPHDDAEPWEYEAPEGQLPATAIPDPFTTPEPDPAA